MNSAEQLLDRYTRLRTRYSERDTRMAQVKAIREGNISQVAPDLFPSAGPFQEPIIANMIDVAARDMAEKVAPLPSFNCASPTMLSERARSKATLKTKIALGYVTNSNLQVQMYTGADKYITYGMLPIRVEIDYETSMPFIRVLDPIGAYPEIDRFGRVRAFFQRTLLHCDELIAQYPEFRGRLTNQYSNNPYHEVIFYHDAQRDVVLLGGTSPVVLDESPNPLGKCMVKVAMRPGVTDIPRGQFDDVIFVQLAKSMFARLALQAAHEAVNAPIIVPNDVPDVPVGPGATIRTNNPQGVGRLNLQLPSEAFTEQQALERELTLGSRFPEARTGNIDASVVTGKGVTALMDGYDSQIRAHQAVFAATLQEIIALCFETDEKVFPGLQKNLRGTANGTPYEITYTPSRAIDGDYTVDVAYGLMAGLDPNRALVFGLQARAEKLFSRDLMRRELPIDIDAEEEARKVDIEDLEETAKQAIQGLAQSIPALAAAGQDPSQAMQSLAAVIEGRKKGRTVSEIMAEVFTPPPPPEPQIAAEDPMAAMGMEQQMGAPGETPEGMMPDGRMQGVAPGQMGELPGGRPDLAMMLAGLDSRGNPNLQASISRQQAV